MKIKPQKTSALLTSLLIIVLASARMNADTGTCGGVTTTLPFQDVMNSAFFCQIAEAYFSGLTNGTTASTYSPSANVTREQMAAFITRTMDQSLKRGSERTRLNRFWTNGGGGSLALTTVGTSPSLPESDGTDVWVPNLSSNTVSRVSASDGHVIGAWTGAQNAYCILVAMGRVFITGISIPSGQLYQIDPSQPPGPVSLVSSSLGAQPAGIAFDGQNIWTANIGGSISIVNPATFSVSTVTTGFSHPVGIVYDGANIWVTDEGDNKLKKLDPMGAILASVSVGSSPQHPAFDGTNIWVPNASSTVSVIRATGGLSGTLLATLTGNGLSFPAQIAFDGERILAANNTNSVSLWKASDLTPIGTFSTGSNTTPVGACSDGLNFWITLSAVNKLARF